ncbi:MAG: class I SAM-dependent methyltransferase [Aggregatilineales bacterium]
MLAPFQIGSFIKLTAMGYIYPPVESSLLKDFSQSMQAIFRPVLRLLKPQNRFWYWCYRQLDSAFRPFDNARLQIVDHLHLIPPARYRTGGQTAITEYGYSAGFMAAYIGEHLRQADPQTLDLGCGTGKLVGAVWPFLGQKGHYTGFDIDAKAIAFAKSWYPADRCSFIHAPLYNAHYNPTGEPLATYVWPFANASIDLTLAFSLFTHLNQPDSQRYFDELARVLKPGGLALFTFFLLDERYDPVKHIGTRWHFDRTIEEQPEWYWTSWFKVPERQIAVTPDGITSLIGQNFELIRVHQGAWAGTPGAFLQDTLVFQRKG